MTKGRLIWGALVVGAIAAVAQLALPQIVKEACALTGGRWASAGERYFREFCLSQNDCGVWASTMLSCTKVKPGVSEAQLHFYFWNSPARAGDEVFWETGKPDRVLIRAKLREGKLVSLECPS